MSRHDRERWDDKWRRVASPPAANPLLQRWSPWLSGGVALDVACGLGQNTMQLARHGYWTLGVDGSLEALRRARQRSRAAGLCQRVTFVQVDADHWLPPPYTVDLLCVFNFLDRQLFPALRAAVRSGGLLIYETRHVGVLEQDPGATRRFLLEKGELARLFADWRILELLEGPQNAAILARKPPV